ncbi:F0F1 ATP synthase subunit B [Candidatus Steffania adelgidicola]|uniref:F0F1 ATP synthase subunit B n=1 Tax=Candidatus Steffania adelgidicola TaxID=1076626 RepID=UPI001D01220E|nr:F0F1 ATP synthase subunit B [Candidatus Steffania adelgidicola]UDG80234.1 ATP synthase subunit b [Candidatus Steffania adelgidicola]
MNLNATMLGQTIAFILFVLFCMKHVWPGLIAVIENRQKEIADSLAATKSAKKYLNSAKAEAINHLKKAKTDAQIIIEQANKHKAQVIDEAKAEAEIERNKILTKAKAEIDAERQRTREELRKHIAQLVLTGAKKIIERSVDEVTHRDIIDKIIAKL